ncbi:hypothetical protein NDU88_005052 [Pleurodeles waltl]|uniref:Uncharacterized protein n=1 Tax=Pleurodeles waltl TaxID=8319 RepID=A0AAV7UGX2_PLEWA|nr:hypothetical protein NDU88_005052 [Pleurodeles waltl]
METLHGIKLFPAITKDNETEGRKATRKTNNCPSESEYREGRKSAAVEEESDDDELIIQLLRDRPPPYIIHESGPNTSADPTALTQVNETISLMQVNASLTQNAMQSGLNVPTTPVVQNQMHPPQVQRICPDVPIMETTSNLMAPTEQIYPRPMLVQTESTPLLLSQVQPQVMPRFTPVTGTQSDVTLMMNQNMRVTLPLSVSARTAPDDISLPITIGPAVALFAQKKPVGEGGAMSQTIMRGRHH